MDSFDTLNNEWYDVGVLRAFLKGCVDLTYPTTCILCKKFIAHSQEPLFDVRKLQVCLPCQNKILPNNPPFCCQCSRPLEKIQQSLCKACAKTSYSFDQVWGTCLYDETMQKLLYKFKYGNKTALRFFFYELMRSFIKTYRVPVETFDNIVPVPLHSSRLRERGFNQTELLSASISEQFHIPMVRNNLVRTRNTKNQAILSRKERWTNILGAFKINQPKLFKDKKVLLIDDLYTTGVTTSESARLLKESEANNVSVLTLAIAEYY